VSKKKQLHFKAYSIHGPHPSDIICTLRQRRSRSVWHCKKISS
jgi:hypothetical protein